MFCCCLVLLPRDKSPFALCCYCCILSHARTAVSNSKSLFLRPAKGQLAFESESNKGNGPHGTQQRHHNVTSRKPVITPQRVRTAFGAVACLGARRGRWSWCRTRPFLVLGFAYRRTLFTAVGKSPQLSWCVDVRYENTNCRVSRRLALTDLEPYSVCCSRSRRNRTGYEVTLRNLRHTSRTPTYTTHRSAVVAVGKVREAG